MADAFLTRKGGENVTPEVTEQESIIQNITEALVGKVYGANATPETILKGYSAYVHQNLVEGTLEMSELCVDLSANGFKKISTGQFVITQSAQSFTLDHNLGETPKVIFVYVSAEDVAANKVSANAFWFMTGTPTAWGGLYNWGTGVNRCTATGTKSNETSNSVKITTKPYGNSGQTMTIYWKSGVTYNWIAMA